LTESQEWTLIRATFGKAFQIAPMADDGDVRRDKPDPETR